MFKRKKIIVVLFICIIDIFLLFLYSNEISSIGYDKLDILAKMIYQNANIYMLNVRTNKLLVTEQIENGVYIFFIRDSESIKRIPSIVYDGTAEDLMNYLNLVDSTQSFQYYCIIEFESGVVTNVYAMTKKKAIYEIIESGFVPEDFYKYIGSYPNNYESDIKTYSIPIDNNVYDMTSLSLLDCLIWLIDEFHHHIIIIIELVVFNGFIAVVLVVIYSLLKNVTNNIEN